MEKLQHLLSPIFSLLITTQAFAMAKPPVAEKPAPQKPPVDSPTPPPSTPPTAPPVNPPPQGGTQPQIPSLPSDVSAPEGYNVFNEVADPVGRLVDSKFQSYRELMPQRNAQQGHSTDHCDMNQKTQDSFTDRIAYAVELKMHPSQAGLGYVGSYFGLSSNESSYTANSLISHPLCLVNSATLSATIGSGKVPSANTIKKMNEFANRMNQYRQAALTRQREGYVKASKLWSKFMMCISYTESLTSANTSTSDRVARDYAPSDYRRPASVLFYEDPYQDAASRLNIGLFQFTPTASGNIQACIREWNKVYPSCAVSTKASQAEMIRITGSALQTFNAFCGVAKVTGTFAVQVNTTKTSATHPANVVNGKLKTPAERCVSPHFAAGKAYNHFGPFQNSTGDNLDEIMTCTLAGEY